jgi:glycosyltransferase involved in cell wall biosynthesis
MRIAYFSPVPPEPSGIADYSAGLLPFLARRAEVEVFLDERRYAAPPPAAAQFPCRDYREFEDAAVRRRCDVVLYQLGNNPQHAYIYKTHLAHPGVIVLHDHVLHHLIAYTTQAQGDSNAYVAALGEAYGEAGRRHGLDVINGKTKPDFFNFPLSAAAIRAARGVIVHSRYLQERLRREHPGVPVARVAMFSPTLIAAPAPAGGAATRRRFGVAPSTFLIGSFGRVVPTKRIEVALEAFARLRERLPGAHYLIVGEVVAEVGIERHIRRLRLRDAVTVTGSLPEAQFLDYMAACDVCLNLRYPTGGETSASLIQLLGLGRPTIVSRTGAFGEFPDAVCSKVSLGSCEVADLAAELEALAADPARRRRMSAAALDWIARNHRPEDAAAGYLEFLARCQDPSSAGARADGRLSSTGVLFSEILAGALVDLGLDEISDPLLRSLSRTALELAP